MAEEITQEVIDNLADIIWWIRGYRAGIDDINDCSFHETHIRSLRTARLKLAELMRKNKKEQ